jgi:hypothetical protein
VVKSRYVLEVPESFNSPRERTAFQGNRVEDWVISRKGTAMDVETATGYFYGVLLGDGHINYTPLALADTRRGPMLMLKCCDLEMIEAWRDAIKVLIGFDYKISKHNSGINSESHRQQYKLRVAQREFVDDVEMLTEHKTKIPLVVSEGSKKVQLAFIQGLMDAEAWINCFLSGGIGLNDMTLGFACCDSWFDEFYRMVQLHGIKVSKIYFRKPVLKKNGEPGKTIKIFRLDIPSYINAGLGFTIKRKAARLAFCSRILNDYTREYPRYEDFYHMEPGWKSNQDRVEDIVWPATKVAD